MKSSRVRFVLAQHNSWDVRCVAARSLPAGKAVWRAVNCARILYSSVGSKEATCESVLFQ